MSVRLATPEEVVDVRHAVLRAGQPRHTAVFDGDHAPTTRHWVAHTDDVVIGVVTVIAAVMPPPLPAVPEAPRYQLRGMAVLPEWRGHGHGDALLLATHADVALPMWCNARAGVVGFYARHGWRVIGEPFELPAIGPHLRMWWPGRAATAGGT